MRQSNFIEDWIQQAEKQDTQRKAQSMLIGQIRAKFGGLSESMEKQIQAITDEKELDRLSIRVITAKSLDEMGINGGAE